LKFQQRSGFSHPLLTVPKICQEYRKVSKSVEKYLIGNAWKFAFLQDKSPIFCAFFFVCYLHTVEVAGSNPASPTTFFNNLIP